MSNNISTVKEPVRVPKCEIVTTGAAMNEYDALKADMSEIRRKLIPLLDRIERFLGASNRENKIT